MIVGRGSARNRPADGNCMTPMCAAESKSSREAYGLTYTSCQESGKYNRLFRDLAAETGMDVATVRAALEDGWLL
jgi:hypothetical protein